MKQKRTYIGFMFFLWMMILFSLWHIAAATDNNDKPVRILILPFDIHADKDLSFLRDGIEDMLSTRLTMEDKIIPISREQSRQAIKDLSEPVNEKIAMNLGEKLRADYVLYGSLTVFEESISTDAKFFDIHKKKNVAAFYEVGENNSDVIFHINRFAEQVNETVFGRSSDESSEKIASAPVDESRKHPESLWLEKKEEEKKEVPQEPVIQEPATKEPVIEEPDDASSEPEIIIVPPREQVIETVPEPEPESTVSKSHDALWKSKNFDIEIRNMAIGDVDGDGKEEIVFIDEKNLFIYRYIDGRLSKMGETGESGFNILIGIDVADINQNGKAEIFVTNLNENNNNLKSYVLEWNGMEFVRIADNLNWYFRVINVPKRGDLLMGQRRGIRDLFIPGIKELKWKDNQYEPIQDQVLPLWINLFSFTYGDICNNGKEMIVAFAENDYIRLLNLDGSEEWRSSEPFGGSPVYLKFPLKNKASVGRSVQDTQWIYLSQRLLIVDMDNDGKNELIVAKNTDAARRLFSKLRLFKSGHIESLVWDNVGLYPKWKTREISGHITDYAIGDIDRDGKDELVFSVVAKISSVLGSARSFIISQKIELGQN